MDVLSGGEKQRMAVRGSPLACLFAHNPPKLTTCGAYVLRRRPCAAPTLGNKFSGRRSLSGLFC